MLILTDFISHIFILLVVVGALLLILRYELRVVFGKDFIKHYGWGKTFLIDLLLSLFLGGIWLMGQYFFKII